MLYQIQINTQTKEVYDIRTEKEVSDVRPWGSCDAKDLLKIVSCDLIEDVESEIYPGILYTLREGV